MTTKQLLDTVIATCKKYIDSLFEGYDESTKDIVSFEKNNMARYSGNAPIDHKLFRRFLRQFDPEEVRSMAIEHLKEHIDESSESVWSVFQRKEDASLSTTNATVTGAINEVHDGVEGLKSVVSNKAEKDEVAALAKTIADNDKENENAIKGLSNRIDLNDAAIEALKGKQMFRAVSNLPTTGEKNVIYLVPADTTEENNYRNEYMWINDKWELIGSTMVDLSEYAKTEEVEALQKKNKELVLLIYAAL